MDLEQATQPTIPPIPTLPADWDNYKMHRRFDRMGRLVGDLKMKRLIESHVMVLGLGGVGSWALESIVRSGVGKVTLVDFDEVCVTNINRQLHALSPMVGRKKAEVMAERVKQINPRAEVHAIAKFYNADHQAEIFARRPDYVVDAIDNLTAKCHLLDHCRKEAIPVVCSTGSSGRLDPSQIKVADLGATSVDPLAREVRKILRQKYGFPEEGTPFGISAVYSTEPHRDPEDLHYDGGQGFRCVCPQGENPYFNCERRNIILGNASFITGTFGLYCASIVVNGLLEGVPL